VVNGDRVSRFRLVYDRQDGSLRFLEQFHSGLLGAEARVAFVRGGRSLGG
jgi:hypothetical protein